MAPKNDKKSVALSSIFASAFLTLLKLVVGLLTGSIGILSEAAHSFLDLGAATLTYFAVSIGDKPADLRHPYGHGKVESVSALVETGLLFLTSLIIIYEAIKRFLTNEVEVKATWYAFLIVVISILVDYSRSRSLSRMAKETKSQALEADALHFSSDILSSLVVLIGLVFVFIGVTKADAIAAMGVSIFVMRAGYQLGKRTLDVLVDAAPVGLSEKITAITKKVEGVVGIEKLRVRPAGANVFVEMVVSVSRKMPLEKAQALCLEIENQIHLTIPEADVSVHARPVSLDDESIREQVQILANNHGLSAHDIVAHTHEDGVTYISFDLEVTKGLTIIEAHDIADHLEETIKKEISGTVEINSHIEPTEAGTIEGKAVSEEELLKINKVVSGIAEGLKLVRNVHEVKARKADGRLFLSIHCGFDDDAPLEKVHEEASRFEYLIKQKIKNTQRVLIHPEPLSAT